VLVRKERRKQKGIDDAGFSLLPGSFLSEEKKIVNVIAWFLFEMP